MNIDNALDGIYSQDLINTKKAEAQEAFEQRMLKKLLTSLGLEKEIPRLRTRVKEVTGYSNLNFEFFYSEYPSFPIQLAFRRIGFVHETKIPDLFNKFTSTKIVETWAEAASNADEDAPVATIFDFAGVKGTQLVCHNWSVDKDLHETRICRRIGQGRGQLLWIERYQPFVETIKQVWSLSSAELN